MNRHVQQMSIGNENNAWSSDGRKKTATGEQRDAIGTNIGNKVQDTGQELPPHDQIRAKEKTTAEWKTTITRVTGQKL